MAGARAALLPLLLHLGSLALAARGESERPGCAPTYGSAQQTVGPGQTTSPSPPGLRVAGRPWCSLSVLPVGGRRAARQGLLNWAGSFCGPCQGVLSSGEAEAVLASEYLKLIICIEERGRGALSVGNDLVLSGLHLWLVSAKAE